MSCGKNCKCGKECKNEKKSEIIFEELEASAHNVGFPGEADKFSVCSIAGNVFIELHICDVPGAEDIVALFPVEYDDEDGFQVMVPDYVADINEKLLRDLDITPVIVDADDEDEEEDENEDCVAPDEPEDDEPEFDEDEDEDEDEDDEEEGLLTHLRGIADKFKEGASGMRFGGAFMLKDGKLTDLTDKVATPDECAEVDEVQQLECLIDALKEELAEKLASKEKQSEKPVCKPAEKSRKWTEDEIEALRNFGMFLKAGGKSSWDVFAPTIGRSAEACRRMYAKISK